MNVYDAYEEVGFGRSNFQIDNFVVGQHDSHEVQYRQLVLELRNMLDGFTDKDLEIQKLKAEVEELGQPTKKSEQIEIEILNRKIKTKELDLRVMKKELDYLQAKFDASKKYSREDLEATQLEYWKSRLLRVSELQFIARQIGVDWGQLEALQQADFLEEGINEIPKLSRIKNAITSNEIE